MDHLQLFENYSRDPWDGKKIILRSIRLHHEIELLGKKPLVPEEFEIVVNADPIQFSEGESKKYGKIGLVSKIKPRKEAWQGSPSVTLEIFIENEWGTWSTCGFSFPEVGSTDDCNLVQIVSVS